MPDSLSLAWGHLVHFAKFTVLQFLKPVLPQFSSDFIQTLCKVYANHWAIHAIVLAIYQKFKKKYGILKFFLTQDHMQLEISKCCFSHNFHWSSSKLYENIGYHAKSKCNEKLASST